MCNCHQSRFGLDVHYSRFLHKVDFTKYFSESKFLIFHTTYILRTSLTQIFRESNLTGLKTSKTTLFLKFLKTLNLDFRKFQHLEIGRFFQKKKVRYFKIIKRVKLIFPLFFRWITVASGALRLYFQTSQPSLGLRKFVAFIVQVYAPVSFGIRKDGHVTNGSRHFFNLIRAGLDHLKTIKERELFKESILNNNFFR